MVFFFSLKSAQLTMSMILPIPWRFYQNTKIWMQVIILIQIEKRKRNSGCRKCCLRFCPNTSLDVVVYRFPQDPNWNWIELTPKWEQNGLPLSVRRDPILKYKSTAGSAHVTLTQDAIPLDVYYSNSSNYHVGQKDYWGDRFPLYTMSIMKKQQQRTWKLK